MGEQRGRESVGVSGVPAEFSGQAKSIDGQLAPVIRHRGAKPTPDDIGQSSVHSKR